MVARLAHNQEAAGSNPAPGTFVSDKQERRIQMYTVETGRWFKITAEQKQPCAFAMGHKAPVVGDNTN